MTVLDEIKKYCFLVKSIDYSFRQLHNSEDVLRSVKTKAIPKRGKINIFGIADYSFHGIGCRVWWKNKTVNFDYIYDNDTLQCDIFSVFDILEFLKSENYEITIEQLDIELSKLVNKKQLKFKNKRFYLLE